jgi:hypothetical protein
VAVEKLDSKENRLEIGERNVFKKPRTIVRKGHPDARRFLPSSAKRILFNYHA